MKGKPIEPGCLAMIVGLRSVAENNGRIVRVLRRPEPGYTPPRSPVARSAAWTIDTWVVRVEDTQRLLRGTVVDTRTNKVVSTFLTEEHVFFERHLRRIDDDEEPNETRVTETHKPKAEEVF